MKIFMKTLTGVGEKIRIGLSDFFIKGDVGKVSIVDENDVLQSLLSGGDETIPDSVILKKDIDFLNTDDFNLQNGTFTQKHTMDMGGAEIVNYTVKRINLGEVSGTVHIDFTQASVYSMKITAETSLTFESLSGVALCGLLIIENGGTLVDISHSNVRIAMEDDILLTESGIDYVSIIVDSTSCEVFANAKNVVPLKMHKHLYSLDFDQTKITGVSENFILTLTENVLPVELMTGSISTTDGSDIIAYDENMNRIPLHVSYFDKVGGEIEVNVKIPLLSTATTKIHIGWGKPINEPIDGDFGQYAVYHKMFLALNENLNGQAPWLTDFTHYQREFGPSSSTPPDLSLYYETIHDPSLGRVLSIKQPLGAIGDTALQNYLTDEPYPYYNDFTVDIWLQDLNQTWADMYGVLSMFRAKGLVDASLYYLDNLTPPVSPGILYTTSANEGKINDNNWHNLVDKAQYNTGTSKYDISSNFDGLGLPYNASGVSPKMTSSDQRWSLFLIQGLDNIRISKWRAYDHVKSDDWIKTNYDVHINTSAFITSITLVE